MTPDGPRPETGGIAIRCRRHRVSPSVAIRVWFPGGQLAEGLPGLGLACGRLLVEGTSKRSWDRIARGAEDLGMDLSGFGSPECTGLRVDALRSDWRRALDLAAELATDPAFPEERCSWVREQTLAELEGLAEQPEVAAGWAFLDQLYGRHPWGRPLQGSPESLARLAPEACAEFHRAAVRRPVIVSLVGDVDEDEAAALAAERFAPLAGGTPYTPEVPSPSPSPSPRRVALPAADQAHIFAGQLTVPISHPDFAALEVASVLLGSGPGLEGRIPLRLREREGLAYAASAAAAAGAGSQPGRLVVHVATGPARIDAALAAIREELERFVGDGVPPGELEQARAYLLGSDPFRRETARQLAALQAQSALHGLPFDDPRWLVDSLAELDVSSVEAAVRRHLDPARLLVTLGLPTSPAVR